MDGLIIAVLLITNALTLAVFAGVYWRKQVWKRRANNGQLSFWGLVRENMNQQRVQQCAQCGTDIKGGEMAYNVPIVPPLQSYSETELQNPYCNALSFEHRCEKCFDEWPHTLDK